ncbi:unnamed protein product [Calypogeia fissa]
MVATKRVPLAEVDNGKESRRVAGGTIDGGVGGGGGSIDPLGGFIFVCNNDTMGEDFERHLFGLPQRYQDSVKAIQPGLPLFLYNYSTRCLHGVFEASSDGGLNIEPDAFGENKEARKNGRQSISRFPAQVRVRWREERPPLGEEKFRPVLYHYDGSKFRLQLSKSEAQELLDLFGASPVSKTEEVAEDTGGEWEKVKTKSKGGRAFRGATLAKGPTSPNSSSGRRRGASQNSSSSNGGASLSGFNNFMHEAVGRGRDRDIKTDSAQRWRTDSDSWSGSSSAGTTFSNSGLHDEDRSKKLPHENGFIAEISEGVGFVSSPGFDGINGVSSSKSFIHTNGNQVEAEQKVEIRLMEDDSNELNGFSINAIGGASSNTRSGFVSYSAALKSGMLASAAAENGFGESNVVSAPAEHAVLPNGNLGNRSSTNSYSSAASATNVSPSSLNRNTKGDVSVDAVDGPSQKVGGLSKARLNGEGLASNHAKVSPVFGVDIGKQETKADIVTNGDGNARRPDRAQPWGKPLTVKPSLPEFGSLQTTAVLDKLRVTVKPSGDSSTPPKKLAKDVLKNVVSEGENGDTGSGNGHPGHSAAKENAVKPAEPIVRKNAWQGNDGAVLRLLHDPDPAVNSSPVNGSTTAQGAEAEVPKKQEKDQTPPLQEIVVQSPVEKGDTEGPPAQFPKHFPNSSGALLPHESQSRALPQEGPLFQQGRSVHESRRQQFDNQKHEKHQEDRAHFRKQQGHPQEHLQHPPSMLHTQPHQIGQGLMPLHIPTPSSPGLQQHHHHPLLSPSPQLYRDRSSRSRAGNGNVENVHYRPINRNMLDGDVPLQSPLVPGSWGLQCPVLLMQPVISPVSGGFTFPPPAPQMLVNAEALHAEILEFAQAATPSSEARLHAEAAVECVRSSVKQLWPEADVEVFGSFATGLCLHHSDVDVVVVDAPPPEEVLGNPSLSGARLLTPLIRALASALKENDWCEGLNTIETASMPVIKLRCCPIAEGVPASSPVAIDITIGGKRSESFAGIRQTSVQKEGNPTKPVNHRFEAARNAHNGAAAREFVIERLRQLPALAPLVLLLKAFLRCRSLNDVYSGGLGSFALTLMLVFYLERAPISCGVPQEIIRSSKSPSPGNGEGSPKNGETAFQENGETLSHENGDTSSQEHGKTSPVSGEISSPANGEISSPMKGEISSPVKPETSPLTGEILFPAIRESPSPANANGETSALSVDISQASAATAESVDFSDDESCDSSVLTSTSASSMASMEGASLHGETVAPPSNSSNEEPLLRKAGGIVEELLTSMHSVASPNLGTLLIGFLQHFGTEIDFSRVRLVLRGKNGNPGGLFWHEKNARTLPLCIDDPLRPDAAIGAGSFNIWQVQASMRDMLSLIVRPQPVGSTPVSDGENIGKGPGRRRPVSLLQQFLINDLYP